MRQSMLAVSRRERETAERGAAERIVGLLPTDQAAQFRAMWLEFEVGRFAEACFAEALDRLQSLLLNILAPPLAGPQPANLVPRTLNNCRAERRCGS
jgi:5'-deoxynucleotidase YfbR-like HD superfamily hydrolase